MEYKVDDLVMITGMIDPDPDWTPQSDRECNYERHRYAEVVFRNEGVPLRVVATQDPFLLVEVVRPVFIGAYGKPEAPPRFVVNTDKLRLVRCNPSYVVPFAKGWEPKNEGASVE